MALTEDQRTFNELSTGVYTATLLDETGAAVALASLDSLKLTLLDLATDTVINSRDRQNVLNVNNVVFHATSGLLTWTIQQEDNVIVTAATTDDASEKHLAIFEAVWSTTKRQNHRVELYVKQIGHLTE